MTKRALLRVVVLVTVGAAAGVRATLAPPRSELRSTARIDSVLGVFEGRTPCSRIATQFTGFPAQNCEKIKWELTLYRDPATGAPTTFRYRGTRTERQGRWSIEPATDQRPGARIYRLESDSLGGELRLLSIDDTVLLLLDRDFRVLVGDASWSYALNRTQPSAR